MSDPPPLPRPPLEDVRRTPPAGPGSAGVAPGDRSGFVSRCASIVLIVCGSALAGPGTCYLALTRIKVDFTGPLMFMAGLLMIAGGSVWLSEIGRARRRRRRQ